MDLWLRIKSMNLTRKLEEIDNRKIGLATIRHCKLRQTRFIFSWRLYLGAKQSGFFTDSCFHYFRSSIPFLVLSRSRASPWRQQMAHGACNTISLLAKNEKVWRVLLHRAARDYTRYIKRFSSGISVLPCTFPDVDEEKKNISVEFLRVRLRFHHQKQSNYTSCFLAPRLIQPDDGTGSFVETTKIIFILISIWFIVQWLRNVFACNCIYCLL